MKMHPQAALLEKATIVPAAALAAGSRPARGQRVFDLHPAIHLMVAGAWTAFVAILTVAFMGPGLVVPAAIFAIGVAALFITPGLWAAVAGDDLPKQSWAEFKDEGVDCHTGHLTANQALAQILVLPAMLIGLALFMVAVKAMV